MSIASKVQVWRARRELKAHCVHLLFVISECDLMHRVALVGDLVPRELGTVLRDVPPPVADRLIEAFPPTAAAEARDVAYGRRPPVEDEMDAVQHVCTSIEALTHELRRRRLTREAGSRSLAA